jgi:hypothetical protein
MAMKRSQFGTVIVCVVAAVLFIVIALALLGEKPFLGLACIILALILLLFYRLTIEIYGEVIRISFGIGLIRVNYALADIREARPVRNPWWAGFGIRWLPGYTLYNVSGLRGVELSFKNSKRKVRIGTDVPEEISRYINEVVQTRRE